MDKISKGVNTFANHGIILAWFGVVGSSIATPNRLTKLYTTNRVFRFCYFFLGAYAAMEMDLLKTIISCLVLLAFYDLMRDGDEDSFQPFYGNLFKYY